MAHHIHAAQYPTVITLLNRVHTGMINRMKAGFIAPLPLIEQIIEDINNSAVRNQQNVGLYLLLLHVSAECIERGTDSVIKFRGLSPPGKGESISIALK